MSKKIWIRMRNSDGGLSTKSTLVTKRLVKHQVHQDISKPELDQDQVRLQRPRTIRDNMWRSTVHTSLEEFKRQGWNLAGANLLALAVGLASRHYLYVRPRLNQRDFLYALAPMLVGLALASLIAYLAYGTAVLPQMAALGAVLGLLGKPEVNVNDID